MSFSDRISQLFLSFVVGASQSCTKFEDMAQGLSVVLYNSFLKLFRVWFVGLGFLIIIFLYLGGRGEY